MEVTVKQLKEALNKIDNEYEKRLEARRNNSNGR